MKCREDDSSSFPQDYELTRLNTIQNILDKLMNKVHSYYSAGYNFCETQKIPERNGGLARALLSTKSSVAPKNIYALGTRFPRGKDRLE